MLPPFLPSVSHFAGFNGKSVECHVWPSMSIFFVLLNEMQASETILSHEAEY